MFAPVLLLIDRSTTGVLPGSGSTNKPTPTTHGYGQAPAPAPTGTYGQAPPSASGAYKDIPLGPADPKNGYNMLPLPSEVATTPGYTVLPVPADSSAYGR